MTTSTPRTLPPEAGWYDDRCSRCHSMEQELRRLRDERNELVLELHEARRAPSDPAPTAPLRPAPLPDVMPATRPARRLKAGRQTLSSFPARDDQSVVSTPLGTEAVHGHEVAAASQGIDFGAVSKLSPSELDDLPYGLITLDAEGRVVRYNDTESRLAGFPKDRVIGRKFFGEVAPCARVREFEGRFEDLVRDPARVRVQTFDFVFRFDHSEQHVTIVMTPARRRGHYHLALVRRAVVAR